MTIKKVLISLGIIVAAVVVTIVGIIIVRNLTTPKIAEDVRAIKLSSSYQFQSFNNILAAAQFTDTPTTADEWTKTASSLDNPQGSIMLTRTDSCTVGIMSQLTPYIDKKSSEVILSQAYAAAIAKSEQGTPRDEYVMKIGSDKGDVELYSALYTPTVMLSHPTTTTQTTQGGSIKLIGDYTTLIDVRVFKNPISLGTTTNVVTKPGQIPLSDSLPTVTIKYTCKSSDFVIADAAKAIKSIKLNLSVPASAPQPTSGK